MKKGVKDKKKERKKKCSSPRKRRGTKVRGGRGRTNFHSMEKGRGRETITSYEEEKHDYPKEKHSTLRGEKR